MKIRTMTAIFGKLDRARLELGDGLRLRRRRLRPPV